MESMSLLDTRIGRLDGTPSTLRALAHGKTALIVNVASRCGFTSQYATLEQVHEKYADRGFTVIGVPCNQFGGQEPGSSDQIAEFCSNTYGVTFPMTEKVDVNGPDRHPLYDALTSHADDKGGAGDVEWNFEKFLVSAEGDVVARFRSAVVPDDPAVIDAIEAQLS
jgi:glutathione peroxidase